MQLRKPAKGNVDSRKRGTIETVSRMLGHKSIRTTQIYAKITRKKISNNMQGLKEKLKVGNELKINGANR